MSRCSIDKPKENSPLFYSNLSDFHSFGSAANTRTMGRVIALLDWCSHVKVDEKVSYLGLSEVHVHGLAFENPHCSEGM